MRRFHYPLAIAALVLRAHAAVLDVPFVKQSRRGCGAAAVAMLVSYWARESPELTRDGVTGEAVQRELRPSGKGLSGETLRRYLKNHGFSTFVFSGGLDDLRGHTAKGRPIIVCLRAGKFGHELHFVVVDGIQDSAVVLNDPAGGKWTREPIQAFEREWSSSGNWALLAVPGEGP